MRPSDVFVVTYPKCGTTWVSNIVHCLRSRGFSDFEEIEEMVPWTLAAYDCDQNLCDDGDCDTDSGCGLLQQPHHLDEEMDAQLTADAWL